MERETRYGYPVSKMARDRNCEIKGNMLRIILDNRIRQINGPSESVEH